MGYISCSKQLFFILLNVQAPVSHWVLLLLGPSKKPHGVREGWLPKGRGAEQTKHCMFMTQRVCPLVSPIFLYLGPLSWGAWQNPGETYVATLQSQGS